MKTLKSSLPDKFIAVGLAVLAALFVLFAAPSTQAAARTWSGGDNIWSNLFQGGWSAIWTNGDTGTFNGPGGTVTVKSAISNGVAALAFTAGNYTLQSDGATERVISFGYGTNTIGNGVTATIGSNVTLTRANVLVFDGNSTATSTLNINSGGKFATTASASAITIREATANVNTGGTIDTDSSIVVGDTADGATLNVLGGTVIAGKVNANASIVLGNTATATLTANLKITGGSFGFTNAGTATTHGLRIGPQTPGVGVVTGTIDLEGGIVTVRRIFESSSTYNSTVNFHGGTLKALATEADYINVDNIWIKSGGVTFDSNGGAITVNKDLLTDVVSTGGGLTLNDTAATKGTLTLTGALTYTGPTLVSAGKLVVPSTHAGTGALTVSANATLGVTVSGISQWQPASLTLANPCTLEFNSVQNPGTTTAPLRPTASVGAVSGVTINLKSIAGTVLAGNSYPLLGNQGGTTNGYTLGSQPAGITGSLAVNGTTLVYTVSSVSDIWAGTDGTNPTWWDIATTANWTGKALVNPSPGTYVDGDNVLFDDTAAPASPVTVDIQTAVAPGKTVFANSTKAYIVTNTSPTGIGGSGSLIQTGSGTLTLSGSNTYSGGTYFTGNGVLALAHSSAAGSGPINFASTQTGTAGTVALSGDINVTNPIQFDAATGRNTINSTSGDNALSGNITIINNSAYLIVLNNNAAGTTFTVGGATPNSTTITAPTYAASLSFRGGAGFPPGILNSQINAPNATVDGNNFGNWTINSTGNNWAITTLASTSILKLGANNALATGAYVNHAGTGSLDLNGFNQTVAGLAGSSSTGTIANHSATSDSILTVTGLTTNRTFPGIIADGTNGMKTSLVLNDSSGFTQTLSGTNTYTGITTISAGTLQIGAGGTSGSIATTAGVNNSGALIYNRSDTLNVGYVISGGGTLTQAGTGTVSLNNDNNYTGATTISAGTLQLGNGGTTGSLSPSSAITNNGNLAFYRSDTITSGNQFASVINGSGNVQIYGGTVQMSTNNVIAASGGLDLAANGTTSAILDLNGYDQTLSRLGFSAVNAAGNLTITGGANSKLTINATTDAELGAGGSITTAFRDVTTDMSGLGEFVWNGLTNTFRSGLRFGVSNGSGINPGTATTTLASTNTIKAATLAVGTQGASNHGGTNVLHLGQANVLNVDSIQVGTAGRCFATLDFRTGLTAPTVTIRGTNAPNDAAARVTTWDVGRVLHTADSTWTATNDFSAGQLDARVTSLRIGRADTLTSTGRAGTENAAFIMAKGTLDATTLAIGQYASGTGGAVKASSTFAGNGTFELNDAAGTVTAENVILADNLGTATLNAGSVVNVSGTFNLNAGTLEAKTIDYGTQTGNANGTITRTFNFTGGTVRNYPGFDLAIANVPINLTGSGSRSFEATAGQTITVASSSVISGSGQGFSKTGAGTLILSGANTYTGSTTVSAGSLLVNGSLAADSAVTVNGGTLGGTGVINGLVAVNTGGTLSPGTSPGILTLNSNLVLNAGSTNLFEVDTTAPTNDLVVLGGSVTYGGVLKIVPTGTFSAGQTFTLFSGLGATNVSNFASIQGSPGGSLAFSFTNGVLSVVSTGPATPPATLLTNSLSGTTLTLSWPTNQGWRLQQQTNALSVGLRTNWVDVTPGSANSTNITVDKTKPTTFYRLVYP